MSFHKVMILSSLSVALALVSYPSDVSHICQSHSQRHFHASQGNSCFPMQNQSKGKKFNMVSDCKVQWESDMPRGICPFGWGIFKIWLVKASQHRCIAFQGHSNYTVEVLWTCITSKFIYSMRGTKPMPHNLLFLKGVEDTQFDNALGSLTELMWQCLALLFWQIIPHGIM